MAKIKKDRPAARGKRAPHKHKAATSRQETRCQKCGHQRNIKECQIRFCDDEGEKEISLTFCGECRLAFERRLKQLKLKTDDLLTEEQLALLVIDFLSEKSPILAACQKCGNEYCLGRHHPYPQRWFGHSIVFCDGCHTGIEREILRRERTEGKKQKELPRADYAKLTLRFIAEHPSPPSGTSQPETIIYDESGDSHADLNKMNQTLVETIVELKKVSEKMGRIAAYLKKMKRRKASWLQEESDRAQRLVRKLEKMGDDFCEIECLLKSSR